jgi:Acetyltransferase (GNAT) family
MKIKQIETPADALDMEELASLHHEEYGGSREFDHRAISKHCFLCCRDKERKFANCWVAYDDDNRPIGYVAGTMRDSIYSFRYFAVQEMWYVVPRARRTRTAVALLMEFERWAVERNAERIYAQVEHDADDFLIERIFRLMNVLGYRKQGYIGVKVPNSNREVDNDSSTHRSVGTVERQAAQD